MYTKPLQNDVLFVPRGAASVVFSKDGSSKHEGIAPLSQARRPASGAPRAPSALMTAVSLDSADVPSPPAWRWRLSCGCFRETDQFSFRARGHGWWHRAPHSLAFRGILRNFAERGVLQEQAVRTFVDGHLSVEKAIAVWRVLRQTMHQRVVHLGQGQGVSDPYPRSPGGGSLITVVH